MSTCNSITQKAGAGGCLQARGQVKWVVPEQTDPVGGSSLTVSEGLCLEAFNKGTRVVAHLRHLLDQS